MDAEELAAIRAAQQKKRRAADEEAEEAAEGEAAGGKGDAGQTRKEGGKEAKRAKAGSSLAGVPKPTPRAESPEKAEAEEEAEAQEEAEAEEAAEPMEAAAAEVPAAAAAAAGEGGRRTHVVKQRVKEERTYMNDR
eukprot:4207356-Prymnesium_polylepis.1